MAKRTDEYEMMDQKVWSREGRCKSTCASCTNSINKAPKIIIKKEKKKESLVREGTEMTKKEITKS